MPKQSAKDELIARINADLAQINQVSNYVGGDGSEALSRRINADTDRLNAMRDYVTGGVTDAPAEKKRTRGKGKRGLPTTANVDGV